MPCVCPIDAWYASRLNENGKRSIVFSPSDGFLDRHLKVPCSKCVGCRADQARMWAVRIYHEASLHERNAFLTLTYESAPPSLSLDDLQRFIKRLRHRCNFRYFACGEYGDQTGRPHYHMALFGADFLGGAVEINDTLYTNPILQEVWGHGLVSVGNLTLESSMYVAGYVNKKLGEEETFCVMSRRPGIGHDWLDRYSDDIRRIGACVIEGKKFPVPLRYLAWNPDEFEVLKRERKARFVNQTVDEKWQQRIFELSRKANYQSQLAMKRETL